MRLWTLHPRYLDAPGILAHWRETLLALAVLQGKTKGYKNHPQLDRFKTVPLTYLCYYAEYVACEMISRGYFPDMCKIPLLPPGMPPTLIEVASGQIEYETERLLIKLGERDAPQWSVLWADADAGKVCVHPLFKVIPGEIEPWERVGVSNEKV